MRNINDFPENVTLRLNKHHFIFMNCCLCLLRCFCCCPYYYCDCWMWFSVEQGNKISEHKNSNHFLSFSFSFPCCSFFIRLLSLARFLCAPVLFFALNCRRVFFSLCRFVSCMQELLNSVHLVI